MAVIITDVTERIRDIKRREHTTQRQMFEPNHGDVQAVIKEKDGSTTPTTKPGKTYVSFWNQPESLVDVWNSSTVRQAETPVWVGPQIYPPFALEIKGVYQGELSQGESGPTGTKSATTDHGDIHEIADEAYPGASPTLVWQPMMQHLKTTGDGATLTTTTQHLIYFRESRRVYFSGQSLNLTSYVPTAGNVRKVLIYLDITLNLLVIVSGSTVPTGGAVTVPYPDIPLNGIPSAYIELTGGQTAITTATHIEDSRDFLRSRNPMEQSHAVQSQADGIHSPFRWIWDDEAARLAETDVTTDDVTYKTQGLQLDEGSLWVPTSVTPTWLQIGESDSLVSRHVTNHINSTWYSLFTDGISAQLAVPADTTWTVTVILVGRTKSLNAQKWNFELKAMVDNNSGTTTVSSTTTNIYRSDTAYTAQLAADDTNDAMEVQVRRVGGVNWDVEWKASVHKVAISYP